MLLLSFTEENYIKAIYNIQHKKNSAEVSVNEIAEKMQTRPATVTDMLRKLSEKELIHYEKYKKITLTENGFLQALQVVRKHRLWETFLHDKLNFSWDEVHEVAEQMEHIHSLQLIDRLDDFLGKPKFDPHGDPIPDAKGELPMASSLLLSDAATGHPHTIVAVRDTSAAFLQQLEKMGLQIGTGFSVVEKMPFDNSCLIEAAGKDYPIMLSEKISKNILVKSV